MSAETAAEADIGSLMGDVEQIADGLVAGVYARVAALGDVPAETESLHASFAAGGTSLLLLCLQVVLTVAIVLGVSVLVNRWLKRMPAWGGAWRRFFALVVAAAVALVAGFIAARLLGGAGLPLRTLRLWTVVAVVGPIIVAAVRSLLMASRRTEFPERSAHMTALVRDLSLAFGWAIVGVTLFATLRLWNVGPGLGDLLRTGLGIPIYLLFAWVVWRHRRTMAAAVAGPRPRSRWRTRLAKLWPAIVIAFLVITLLSTQIALTLGAPLRGGAVLLTALIVLLTPHLDAIVGTLGAARAGIVRRLDSVGRRAADGPLCRAGDHDRRGRELVGGALRDRARRRPGRRRPYGARRGADHAGRRHFSGTWSVR